MKISNLDKIKETTKLFIRIIKPAHFGYNMFTLTPICYKCNGNDIETFNILNNEGLDKWYDYMSKTIDKQNLLGIYYMVRDPFKLTWA